MSAVFADVRCIGVLRSVKAGSAGNDVARVLGINGDGGFVTAIQAWIADFNGMAVMVKAVYAPCRLDSRVGSLGAETCC